MRKLMLIDENSAAAPILEEILNEENLYKVFAATGKIQAENILKKEAIDMILLNTDSTNCVSAGKTVAKKQNCPPFALMGKNPGDKELLTAFKPLTAIYTPFEIEEFCEATEDAYFTAKGLKDEITGFFKKAWLDVKLERLMAKKTRGFYFSIGVNAYSFAANPATPAQIQTAMYALKTHLNGALFGLKGRVVLGFYPCELGKDAVEKKLDEIISIMCEAAGEPKIYVTAGFCFAQEKGFFTDDMLLYADKGMGVSREFGCNKAVYRA